MTNYSKCPVIFDCDGVLLDWETGFRAWAEKTYPDLRFTSDQPKSWELSHWIGCTKEVAWCLIQEFNRSEAFGYLNSMPYAARTLYEVKRAGHPIYVLTSCSGDPAVVERRELNLREVFNVSFQRTICLDLAVPKWDTLKAFRMVFGPCIWIEDNFDNANAGALAGHESFFLRRPHNEEQWKKGDHRLKHLDRLCDLMSHIK